MGKAKTRRKNRREESPSGDLLSVASPVGGKEEVLRALIVGLLPLFVYGQTIGYPFIRLDDPEIYNNPNVFAGLSVSTVTWAFTNFDFVLYQPVTWLTFIFDGSIYGKQPSGFHLTNLVFHVCNGLVLYWALCAITHARWKSAIVGALFALHPLHVENVAWISDRKDLVSAFFGFFALWAYAFYAKQLTWKYYTLAWLAFLCGMLAKPMLITLPCLMLLLDYWPLRRINSFAPTVESRKTKSKHGKSNDEDSNRSCSWYRILLEKVPFLSLFPLAYVSAVVGHQVQDYSAGDWSDQPLSLTYRIANAVYAYGAYLRRTIWPSDLAVYYPHPRETISLTWVFVSAIFLLIATAVAISLYRKRPYLTVGWLWFIGALFPVIKILEFGGPFQMADRYTYIPLIGVFIAVVWLVGDLARERRWPRGSVSLVAAVIICLCMLTSFQQTRYWKSSVTLFERTLEVTENNVETHYLLAVAHLENDNLEQAVEQLKAGVRIMPDSQTLQHLLAQTLFRLGRLEESLAHFENALEINPDEAKLQHDLGLVLVDLKRWEQGIAWLRKAHQTSPDEAVYRIDLADAFCRLAKEQLAQQDTVHAVECYRESIEVDGSLWQSHNDLGLILMLLGKRDKAIVHFRTAVRLAPDSKECRSNLARALASDVPIE